MKRLGDHDFDIDRIVERLLEAGSFAQETRTPRTFTSSYHITICDSERCLAENFRRGTQGHGVRQHGSLNFDFE